MAQFKISNIKIAGISACVPKNIVANRDNKIIPKADMETFISSTGVEERRVADLQTTTSDLGLIAAEKLISDLGWDKNDIDILIFVSQTADYRLPVTSTILQDRLGLSKDCAAYDMPLGCSGYIYGISSIAAFMSAARFRKGLLIVGDTTQSVVSKLDKSTEPLFGDAATATAFAYDESAADIYFDIGTDGSGYKAIIIEDGAARNPFTERSLVMEEIEPGIIRNRCNLVLEGMDVFSFGITQAPKTVNALIDKYSIDKNDVDYFVFHQANLMMNKMINKKLKLPEEKVPYSLKHFGNTSSASIPLTIVTQLKDKINNAGESTFMLCGFGVGLSWGTCLLKTNDLHISELLEV